MSGGVWVFQIKSHHLQCEHFNWLNSIPGPEATERSPHSPHLNLRINILEPLQRHEVLTVTHPAAPRCDCSRSQFTPVLRANNAHFEQVQRLTGELQLGGETLAINCLSFRDRSWESLAWRCRWSTHRPPGEWGLTRRPAVLLLQRVR
jgi:hypothetical protein